MTGTWATGWATGDIVTAAEFKKGAGAIFDSTLGGSAANIDITSIVATFSHLLLVLYARSDSAASAVGSNMRFNGDTAANYDTQVQRASAAATVGVEVLAATSINIGTIPANTAGANLFGYACVFIPHYAGTANNKAASATAGSKAGTASGNLETDTTAGFWRSSAAINRITLLPAAGNFVAGTRATVYAMGA